MDDNQLSYIRSYIGDISNAGDRLRVITLTGLNENNQNTVARELSAIKGLCCDILTLIEPDSDYNFQGEKRIPVQLDVMEV